MEESSKIKRVGKSLLVAALGVASVSFVSACAPEGSEGEDEEVDQPAEEATEAELGVATQALNQNVAVSASAAQTGTTILTTPLTPSGNLMPPQRLPYEVVIVGKLKEFKPIPPSGNLMATPPIERLTQIEQQAGGN
jgi:hypothetical protein